MEYIETESGSLHVVSQAVIIDDSFDSAWAEKYIRTSKHNAWILGKYVEADHANRNRQFFALDELVDMSKTLDHAPLNIGHAFPPVGAFVASEILYPVSEDAAEKYPFVEALSVMWKSAFPNEFTAVEAAYKSGKLAYSMETKPEKVSCGGPGGCGQEFAYVGRVDPSYCTHINAPSEETAKVFHKPHFTGGALIIPPIMPGWANADVTQVASFETEEAERTYDAVSREFSHLDVNEWETMMGEIVQSFNQT